MDIEQFEKVEAFLQNDLSPEEREKFILVMESNASLKAEVQIQRENMLAIGLAGFEREVGDVLSQFDENTSKSNKAIWIIGIAAAIALLLGSYLFFAQNDIHEELYSQYHTVDVGLPVTMGSSRGIAFDDAMVDFKAGKYELALTKWQMQLKNEPVNDTIQFYTACAFMETGDFLKASSLFNEQVLAGSVFADRAEWYALLCALKMKHDEAVLNLTPIEGSSYLQRIQRIQRELKKQ